MNADEASWHHICFLYIASGDPPLNQRASPGSKILLNLDFRATGWRTMLYVHTHKLWKPSLALFSAPCLAQL